MRLAIDNDFLCKFGCCGALDEFLGELGVNDADCFVLETLKFQLYPPKSGKPKKLRKKYEPAADRLLERVGRFNQLAESSISSASLEPFVGLHDVDPGEVVLFGFAAANPDVYVATGDKRAMVALARVPAARDLVAGRIICAERAMHHLCEKKGVPAMRSHGVEIGKFDVAFSISFGPTQDVEVTNALDSYIRALIADTHPTLLW